MILPPRVLGLGVTVLGSGEKATIVNIKVKFVGEKN